MKHSAGLLLLTLLLFVPLTVRADWGPPRPLARFKFNLVYDIPLHTRPYLLHGVVVDCSGNQCTESRTEELRCTADVCENIHDFWWFGGMKLRLTFSDGSIRESNIEDYFSDPVSFSTASRESNGSVEVREYTATIGKDNVKVTPYSERSPAHVSWLDKEPIVQALLKTLFWELLVAGAFVIFRKNIPKLRLLLSVALVNVISVPALWLTSRPLLRQYNYGEVILGGEILVAAFEAITLFYLNKRYFKAWEVILLSIVINLASYALAQWGSF